LPVEVTPAESPAAASAAASAEPYTHGMPGGVSGGGATAAPDEARSTGMLISAGVGGMAPATAGDKEVKKVRRSAVHRCVELRCCCKSET
jgi:hypothetical protein